MLDRRACRLETPSSPLRPSFGTTYRCPGDLAAIDPLDRGAKPAGEYPARPCRRLLDLC